jgi:hypothetical protein
VLSLWAASLAHRMTWCCIQELCTDSVRTIAAGVPMKVMRMNGEELDMGQIIREVLRDGDNVIVRSSLQREFNIYATTTQQLLF